MYRKIFVVLRGRDPIENLFPYLDDISQPGMTIIFLVHLGARRFNDLNARLLVSFVAALFASPFVIRGKASKDPGLSPLPNWLVSNGDNNEE
jgi:hypothetical protein